MLEKFGKFLDEIHGVMVVAVVLDPRYKMVLVDYFFPHIYGSDASTHIDRIHTLCSDLYLEYKKKVWLDRIWLKDLVSLVLFVILVLVQL